MKNEKSSKQSKEYEKERRDRLNTAFDKLSSLLPDYDPVNSLSKVDILTKAFDHIQKLEAEKRNPAETVGKSCEEENLCLKAKVKHLSSRIRQLMDIMYSAKIEIPETLPPTSTYTPLNHCKWNGKAGDRNVELLLKSICDKNKENKKNKPKSKETLATKNKQVPSQVKNQTRTSKIYRQKKKIIKLTGKDDMNDKLGSLSSISNVVISIADINTTVSETPTKSVSLSTMVPLQENNSKNKIVSTSTSVAEIKTCVTQINKPVNFITAPIMATGIQSTLPIQNVLQNVNLGAYILPNGQLMAVQQQGAIIPQITPQILINRPVPPVLVMQNNNSFNERSSIIIKNNNLICEPFMNNCRPIYPKRKREITRTTFSSQKPIPSLNLNFSSAKILKQMKTETLNERKQKLASKKNWMSKKLAKNDIKKRNCWKGSKSKIDKEILLLKTKRLEKFNLKKCKLQKRVKTKNQTNISNKFINRAKVSKSLLIKRASSLNACDMIRSKKSNLGSLTRPDQKSNAKNMESLNNNLTMSMSAEIRIHSSTNLTSTTGTSDFSNTSKTTSDNLNLKDAIFNDTNFNKSLETTEGEKVSCNTLLKINSSTVEASAISQIPCYTAHNTTNAFGLDPKLVDTFNFNNSKDVLNQLSSFEKNSFLPILPPYLEDVREFPPDILSSLQIPSNLHNSESLSPTAAFLLSFPLVSTSKNSELLNENELSCESQNDNSTSILQIGNIESPSSSLIEGQTVLFDQQYTQLSKSHWLPKSCDKIESNQKYNDSLTLSFENSNADSAPAPNLINKKCQVFSESSCKVENSKNKNNPVNSNHSLGKNPPNTMDKAMFEKKSSFVSSNSDTIKQSTHLSFSSPSHVPTTCSTKEIPKTTPAVCNNLLPIFSELYGAKTEKTKVSDSPSKSNERLCENAKKIKEKEKIKGSTVTADALELNSCDKDLNVMKNDVKNCKDKVSSAPSLVENTSGSTKSLVNWMTAPDVRSHGIEQFSIPELFASQNFDFLATSSVSNSYSASFAPSNIDQLFEYSSTIDNNKLYNPNYPVVLNQTNVWSPSKSSLPHHSVGPHLDSSNFIIPSTLPTLIGDLALGTSTTPVVDAFKTASFEMISDIVGGQKMGDSLTNESQKSSDRVTQDNKTGTVVNDNQAGTRYKLKENVDEKPVSESSRNRQPNKMLPFKKPEFNDKSQQTSAVNFLSVSQLVDQNQVKSNVTDETQYSVNTKRSNISRQKQTNKNACNFYNIETGSEKQATNKNRSTKKAAYSSNNGSGESVDTSSNQRPFNQIIVGNKIENSNSGWYPNQNQKESSSLETNTKLNNYSAESLLNNGNCHSQTMNYAPSTELHIPQNCSPEKSGKLQSSCVSNYFIPPAQPYPGNIQQITNVIPPSNSLSESLQFTNQNYLPEANIGYEKTSSGYYSFVPSSQTCHVSAKNVTNTKPEPNINFYPSASPKNSKEKRSSCKQGIDAKNQVSIVELNHGINSYITPPFTRSLLTSTLSTSNYLFTDPVYTNTQSSLQANKVDNFSAQYSNENFLKPCVSISDYAPFDDCNFKTAQNPLSITNTLVSSSTNGNNLYLPHTSLPCNALATNFKNNAANFPNFLTPVVSTNSLSVSNSNASTCTPLTSTNASVSIQVNGSTFPPSTVPSGAVPVTSISTVSNYLPTFIGSSTSLTSTSSNFSNYLSPIISTSKGNKKAPSSSTKSNTSSSTSNYLPPIISTTSITSSSCKISSYLPPAISNSSLLLTQSNSISNYLPSIIPSNTSSAAGENCLVNYLPPVISSSNALGNTEVSNYLPPVLPTLNDSSLYLPLNNSSINSTPSSISTQYLHPSSVACVTSTTTNSTVQFSSATYLPYSSAASTNKDSSSSSHNKYLPSRSHGNTPSYQPYTSNISTVNPAVSNSSSNYLPVFSSKTSNSSIASNYMPVFSNSSSVPSSSSSYLPVFSSSSSDLTIISSNYPPLPNSSQGHNSFPPLNTSYTSNYLPPSNLPSSNYFPVTLNSVVSSNPLATNPTPNYASTTTPFNATNTGFNSASVPTSNNFSTSSSVPSRSTNKSCKTSPSSCKNFIPAKSTNSSSENPSSEIKKLQPLNNKPNQTDVGAKSNAKITSVTGTQSKSCNPCGTKFSNSSNASPRSAKTSVTETALSNTCKQSAQFEMPKLLSRQQTIAGNFEMNQSNISFGNNTKASIKTSSLPTMFSINSGSANNFNCIYSTSDNVSYQPVNVPNTFQNRAESMDPASICPLPGFSNDIGTYSIKNGPTSQKYVPPNEQIVYNTGSNSGSSSLTNFNLCAILPEMNEKLRCHNTINSSFIAQGVTEQPPFGKYDFYQYPEKKGSHQTSTDKKGQQMQHVGQTGPLNQPLSNNTKPASSSYQNNLETS